MNHKVMTVNTRLDYMDFLKFIAIFCVCYGHCIQHFLSGVPSENTVFRVIYSFHMPLFMAITGYFCYLNKEISLWYITKKKIRQLILPGTVFSITISLIHGFPNGFHFTLCPFWFLQSAFICTLLYYLGSFFTPPKMWWCSIIVTLMISQTIIYANVFRLYPAFVTGIMIHQYWYYIEKHAKLIAIVSMSTFLIMVFFLTAEFYGQQDFTNLRGIICAAFHLGYRITIGNIAVLGMITCAYLSDMRIRTNKLLKVLSNIGRYTLVIYIMQTFIIESLLASILNYDNESPDIFYLFIVPLICITTIVICVLTAKLIERSKIASYFFLGYDYEPISKRFI